MGRKRTTLLTSLAVAPWPVGIVFGIAGFFAFTHAVPAWLAERDGVIGNMFADALLSPLAWLMLTIGLLGAALSGWRQHQRRRLLNTRTDLESLAAAGWRNFERLAGEAFRRQGYRVEETGLGGADGGIDLILRKAGRRTLVQCKQWRRQQVGVGIVREMYGLLAHHGADAVKIVSVGRYTRDARAFAQGKPIELINGETLLQMIRQVQPGGRETPLTSPAAAAEQASIGGPSAATSPSPVVRSSEIESAPPPKAAPTCPNCGTAMVVRRNRATGVSFWGCSGYPRCRLTRAS